MRLKRTILGFAVVGGLAIVAAAWWRSRPPPPPPALPVVGPAVVVHLTGPDGAPVLDCGATLWRVEGSSRRMLPDSTKSCAHGLLWPSLEPGTWRLMLQAPGTILIDETYDIGPDEVLDLALRAEPGGDLYGRVLDADGAPVPGALVTVRGRDRDPLYADRDGDYALRGLAPGPVTVRALSRSPLHTGETPTRVVAGQRTPADISLVATPGVFGVKLTAEPRGARVNEVMPDGGAAQCGVVAGDVLTAIDGASLAGLSERALTESLGGEADSEATVTVSSDGAERAIVCRRMAL